MEEVLVSEETPQLVRGVVIQIPRPNLSGAFLRVANELFPLEPHARHLKRIRKVPNRENLPHSLNSLGVSVEHNTSCDGASKGVDTATTSVENSLELLLGIDCSVDTNILQKFQAVSDDGFPLIINTVFVPDRAPRISPAEWKRWSAVWPFAVPKPPPLSPLPPDEVRNIRRLFSEVVMPLAKVAQSGESLGIAAALVDVSKNWRVLATSNGEGLLNRSHAAACFGYLPTVYGTEGDSIVLNHPVTYVLKLLARIQHEDDWNTEDVPYLANNIDLIVSHEPCVMCSMALVHSRVRRVFYCFPNTTHGGLGSIFSIHAIPSLNHHFRVFRCSASWICEYMHNEDNSLEANGSNCWEMLRES